MQVSYVYQFVLQYYILITYGNLTKSPVFFALDFNILRDYWCNQVYSSPQVVFDSKDKVQLEQEFWDGLQVFIPKGLKASQGDLKRIEKNLYVSEQGWYETESVQNTAFFRKWMFGWIPLCESDRPAESAMTLLTGHTGKKQYTVQLKQHRYKYGMSETEVPLALLLEYCLSQGCIPYAGVESTSDGRVVATLFMVNADAGYCHTFKCEMDSTMLDSEEGTIEAEAYTFTPIHNLAK